MNCTFSHSLDCPPSVLLAHAKQLIREVIAGVLGGAGFRILDQTDAIGQLHQMVRQHNPDLLLLDWELVEEQTDALHALAREFPDSRIVILSPSQPPPLVKTIFEAGARGCLSLNLSSEELIESLNMIAKGDIIVSWGIVEHLVQGLDPDNDQEELFNSLSEREREVISLVVNGMTNREIAKSLIITENTVKVHLRNILDKLDVRNRQQLAAVAVQRGLVSLNPSSDCAESVLIKREMDSRHQSFLNSCLWG
jgi:two-component system, NarL family, nitrate/nitrite response regulator NarL